MHIDASISNHQPVDLTPLADILAVIKASKKTKVMIYLGEAKYKQTEPEAQPHNHGWVSWRPCGMFTDPFNDIVFREEDLDIENSKARMLQPGEVLNVHFHGEEKV